MSGLLSTFRDEADSVWHVIDAFADKHQDGIQALCIVAGLVVAFCGRVILRPVVFLLGFLPSSAVFWLVGHSIVNDANPDNLTLMEKLAAGAAVLLGIVVGLILLKALFRLAVAAICAGMGGVVVLALSLYLPSVRSKNGILILEVLVWLGGMVTMGLSLSIRETMAAFGTAFDGAALATYALSGFLGQRPIFFPPEGDVAPEPVSHAWRAFYGTFVLALGTFCTLMQLLLLRAEHRAEPPRESPVEDGSTATPPERNVDPESGTINGPLGNGAVGGEKAPLFNDEDNGYGATDSSYSVPLNIGAPPLRSIILDPSDGRSKPEY